MRHIHLLAAAAALALAAPAGAGYPVRLANNPSLSPDGNRLAFDWNGDVWVVPTVGGVARPLTQHPGRDAQPKFSPDGKRIAFVSDRDGSAQVYVVPAEGGEPRQVTFHTAGYTLHDWHPDGKRLLVGSQRDHAWRHAERFFLVGAERRGPEEMLFDDYGTSGALSPDGKRLLFTREGPAWWRKGYRGSQSAQLWCYDLVGRGFEKLQSHDAGNLWPQWAPDNESYYYVSGKGGSFALWKCDPGTQQDRCVTHFDGDDSVAFPTVSRDGTTVAFRRLFDFYALSLRNGSTPHRIDITVDLDRAPERVERRTVTTATAAAFSNDGLEIAFIAGGDLWVMDTELREPKRVTATAEEERSPVFAPEGDSILFASDRDGVSEIYRATRKDKAKHWWQNNTFEVVKLTTDGEQKSSLTWSPDGAHVAYVRGRGDLWVMKPDGKEQRRVVAGFTRPQYDWSPDGKWLVYSSDDTDFNSDVWVMPLDGSKPPFNLSRHPREDRDPVWSPDGKKIAFVGRRGTESDIHYVWLRAEDAEVDSRDRAVEKAVEKMKRRGGPQARSASEGATPNRTPGEGTTPRRTPVAIDFEGIHDRIRKVAINDATESNLFWSPDGRKLAFSASIEGRRATYSIDIPEGTRPTQLSAQVGSDPRWLRTGNQIVCLLNGVPATLPQGGATGATPTPTPVPALPGRFGRLGGGGAAAAPGGGGDGGTYRFTALQTVDLAKKNAAVFDLAWRTMRDNWYDERMNNRDWNAVKAKYLDMAAQAPDAETLGTVVNMMLGELNGSHLGFMSMAASARFRNPTPTPAPDPDQPAAGRWRETTAHLGVRFDPTFPGPGLKVRDVIHNGPADHKKSKIRPGEVVLTIDGKPVDLAKDLTEALNGPPARDVVLKVRAADGKEREVTLRPTSFPQVRTQLYEQWIRDNRAKVEQLSGGKLGYLHIQAMAMPSFHKFEEELYAVGYGKEGLVIDVRENGGGSTADHLLTALTQPVHAIAVPRGGGAGYPNDRKVYATWNKPIVVLCNQNSFSNAEIFSHAIKTLKRGKLVGVPTAGGVISTGGTTIMDAGFLRLPFRGWYVVGDGRDMELNGAVPDVILWPQPGESAQGKDIQLEKAVAVLQTDVKEWQARPQSRLEKASERK